MSSRPNILLLFSDQHRYDCLGGRHPALRTPYLDQLAGEGASFDHAYTPIPVCTPARVSLLTGAWPAAHGCIVNAGTEAYRRPKPSLPAFTQILAQAGYYAAHVGKWHVDTHQPPAAYGYHHHVPESDYSAWRSSQGVPPRPKSNGFFGEADPHITPEQSRLAWGAATTLQLLERHVAVAPGQPFFIHWDPSEPHLPNVVPEPFASLYPPSLISPWPNFPDPLIDKPYIQRQQRETWGISNWSWEEWSHVVARYLGEVALLDQQIGTILAGLDELGLRNNTLVIYSADHGDLCGSHGLIDKHFVMYDEVVRVPLILRWPGSIPAGVRNASFVSSALDIASTILQSAGITPPASFAGIDLRRLLQGGITPRADMYSTYYGNQLGLYSQRMLRTHQWKYIWNVTAEDELYDLDNDPAELRNLIAIQQHLKVLGQLRRRLLDWLEATNDPLLNLWTRRQLQDMAIL
jgi:arylsulfatase A-like enzyme